MTVITRPLASAWLLAALSATALAQTPRDLIEQGNAHYAAGRYAEALEAYDRAVAAADGRYEAELLHNRAAAQFKLGKVDEARELWVRAAALKDQAFEADARYNMGNCDYADALKAVQAQDAGKSLELLDRAAAQFRDALRLKPDLANARANLELAETLKRDIKQHTTTQPQSQPSSQGKRQPSSQPSSQTSSSPSSQEQQQSSSQPSQQQAESQPSSQPQEDQQQATSKPATQPEQEPQSQPSASQESEPQPVTQPAGDQADQSQPPVPIQLTREQAERLMQKVRDMERARRRALALREAAKQEPVKRDW